MKYSFPSGSYYEGEMVDDFFEGQGHFYFSNGDVYTGEFRRDKFDGYGEYKFKSGSLYKGYFLNDMFHGVGTFSYLDKSFEKGKFHQDKRVGKFRQLDKTLNKWHHVVYQNDICIRSDEAAEAPDI
jgi:hypothetical protein